MRGPIRSRFVFPARSWRFCRRMSDFNERENGITNQNARIARTSKKIAKANRSRIPDRIF